jgi:uncharacterized protein (TIGR02246 family)
MEGTMTGFPSTASAGAHDEVVRVATVREQAFHDGNLEALMAWFADDAVVTGPASPFRIEGKEALRAYYADLFHAFPTIRVSVRQRSVRVYDTTAVINTYYTLTQVDRGGKVTTTHGRLNVTHVKIGDRWLVVDQHSSLVPPGP